MHKHVHSASSRARGVVSSLRRRRILTRKKILVCLFISNLFFVLTIIANTLSLPNIMIGAEPVGLMNRASVQNRIESLYRDPITLSVNGHTYDLTYEHLGVYLDTERTVSSVFAPNRLPIQAHSKAFLAALFNRKTVDIPLSFSQEFYDYIGKLNEVGMNKAEIVYVNQENKQVSLYVPEQRYTVNTSLFQEELRQQFGKPVKKLIVPLKEAPLVLGESVDTANTRLNNAYSYPLTVIVGLRGDNHFLTLSPDDLRNYTTANLSAGTNDVVFAVNTGVFAPDLTKALSVYEQTFNPGTAAERVGNGITNALRTRFDGGPVESVKVGIDSGPNTDGSVSEKYIEIDISQQKMFTFSGGELVKTYRVSTGKDYPTPVGSFKILNKTELGFSKIYNVWMAYWMAFEYSKELRAYFGIHELPYYYTGDEKIQRPREFIGAPNTGGCVALDIGDAKEVYEFADIGTDVVIYQ